jgi:hypothetical protein
LIRTTSERLTTYPLFHRTPKKKNLLGSGFNKVNILLELLLPDQVANSAWGHLDPITELYGAEIFFHNSLAELR